MKRTTRLKLQEMIRRIINEEYSIFEVRYNNNTTTDVVKKANQEFSDILPSGFRFTVGTTPSGYKRLQLKNGNTLIHEFSPGLKNPYGVLDRSTLERILRRHIK